MRGAAPSGRCPRCDEAHPPGAERLITCRACGLRFDATAPPRQMPMRLSSEEDGSPPPDGLVVSPAQIALPSGTLTALVMLATMVIIVLVKDELTFRNVFALVVWSVMGLWALWYAFSTFGRRTITVEKNQLVIQTVPLGRDRMEVSRTGLLQIVVATRHARRRPDTIIGYAVFAYARGSDILLVEVASEEIAVFIEGWLERTLKLRDDGERAAFTVGS
jgi:hypothetical protein